MTRPSLLLLAAVLAWSAPAMAADGPVVAMQSGKVQGKLAGGVEAFLGIPFAASPAGNARWQPPRPPSPWDGVRPAQDYGPACPQSLGIDSPRTENEDCLVLNVQRPPGASAQARLPVYAIIHGGGFTGGTGNNEDMDALVKANGIVGVTLNYRLGALGFLAHPALEDGQGQTGNYGFMDQQAALRWVHDNIAQFGGDPDAVTIAGESAGGMSVCDHLVAPGSAGLFRAALIQSGPCQAQLALPAAERVSLDYARDAGCGDPRTAAACLRTLPADKLRKPVWYYRIGDDALSGPVTGTTVLPEDPMQAIAQGRAAKVPTVIGSNRDEFTLFVALQYLRHLPYGETQYPRLLGETFGRDAGAVALRYPLTRYQGSVPLAYSAAVTDGEFACVTDTTARGMARTAPVYVYEFNDRGAPAPGPLRSVPFPVGASHSLELRYLFDVGGAPPLTQDQQVLSDQMIDAWSQFVRDGNPGRDWPTFGDDQKRLSLRPDGSRVETDFDEVHQCSFWAGVKG